MGVGSITTGYLNDFDVTMQIDCNKMTWYTALLVVAHPCIRLEGAGTTIVEVIQRRSKPAECEAEYCPEREADQHADCEEAQRMGMLQGTLLQHRRFG